MTKNFILKYVSAGILALCFVISPVHAQLVTAGATGVVRDNTGKAVSGAEVTAVHVPTGTTYTATTNADGRYNMRGMVVGGPFTFTAKAAGHKLSERSDVETQLASDIDVPITLEPGSEVVTMDKFVVQGAANELDSAAAGAASVLSSARLAAKPTSARSLADLISASPFVTLRSTFGDREESQITALGQNNRYNSIQIDGSRINDQFGLNGTGLASFFNPISVDTLEQLSVQVSPYDVRQAGFTGASINAVTKSGTNHFHGSAYYYFTGDHYGSLQLQGEDVSTKINTGVKNVPKLERTTQGFTLGGPIWKDHIFFFLNYEKTVRSAPPSDSGMPTVDATQLAAVKAAFAKYNTDSGQKIVWGDLGGSALNVTREKKYLGKLDWNITKDHRATIRYSSTEGELPQFGSFTSSTRTNSSTVPTLTANAVTAFDSNFYSQVRQERNVTATLFSQWTPNFKTELKWGTVDQPQSTPTNVNAPEVSIFGVTGTNRSNAPTTTGVIVAGTDVNRQPNYIDAKIKQYSAVGDYFYNNFVFTGGVEREASDFINVFRTGSYGVLTFASVADFVADIPARIDRAGYDPTLRPAADLSDFATTGIFGQARWNVNSRLNLTAGVRYEMMETKKKPALFQGLLTTTGFKNNGTMDGTDVISPRIAANWAVNPERTIQLRGGVGHFLGRTPWVLFSNSYNKLGVGDFTLLGQNNPGQGTMTNYLKTFDPANPIGVGTDNPALRREVDFADNGIKLPAVWRTNLGIDRRLSFLDSMLSAEIIYTRIDQALFITNENIRPTTLGADGRQRFAGNPTTAANAKYASFTDLYHIQNVRAGESTYMTVSWNRPMKNHWMFEASYTRGKSTEAQAIGQTTASGQWQRNVVFNQSTVENGTSDFQVKDRILIAAAREFEFIKGFRTLVSLNYEGRSGNPFSWIYANDLNGDGQSNDTVAVPTGPSDPRFDFSAMSATDQANYFAFIENRGLARYAGGVAPKNAFVQPFVNKLDLMVTQKIPLHFRTAELELFFVWTNFGSFIDRHLFNYYEEARTTNDVFRREFIGQGTYQPDGRIRPTFSPDAFTYDNGQSRWKVQLGGRFKF
jgi:hypothetical protein